MNLSDMLRADISGVRDELGAVRAMLTAYGHEQPAFAAKATAVLHRLSSVCCHLTSIESIAAAARMCGKLEPVTPQAAVESLPLFAVPRAAEPPPSLAQLQSLHRSNDHTLDPVEP